MSSKFLNIFLAVAIVLILGSMLFFGFRLWLEKKDAESVIAPMPVLSPAVKKFSPTPTVNRGKASEEHDTAMETAVRAIGAAAQAYAADHKGKYPESDFRNPCAGVRYCLKGVNINNKQKTYLDPIPQVPPYRLDYHYRADNLKKMYCVKTPTVLETDMTKLFQCTQAECGKVAPEKDCN